jgi:hypothetical protein
VLSELMIEFVDSIWEYIIQKVGGKVREIFFETRREIKIDILVSHFTELVRFFKIEIGESIKIKTEYKLWFM